MFIFYKELALEEGFAACEQPKNSRIVAGREISLCGGYGLFSAMKGSPIRCWKCKATADRWISARHQNDTNSKPVLNLFATKTYKPNKKHPVPRTVLVMMTRDHIIPKSMGGVDSILNLRPGCEICNGNRASDMNKADIKFMLKHPELINAERLAVGLAKAQARLAAAAPQR